MTITQECSADTWLIHEGCNANAHQDFVSHVVSSFLHTAAMWPANQTVTLPSVDMRVQLEAHGRRLTRRKDRSFSLGSFSFSTRSKRVKHFQGHSLERPPLSQLSHSVHIKCVPLFQLHQVSSQATYTPEVLSTLWLCRSG